MMLICKDSKDSDLKLIKGLAYEVEVMMDYGSASPMKMVTLKGVTGVWNMSRFESPKPQG